MSPDAGGGGRGSGGGDGGGGGGGADSPGIDPAAMWADAMLAAGLLAVDPAGLGGVSLRAGAGPVRDRWLGVVRSFLPQEAPWRRIPPGIPDDRLLGGLDLAATLAAGRPVAERGVLAEVDGGVLVLAMAERADPATAAKLGAVMDAGAVALERDGIALARETRFGVVALDEGIGGDERPPDGLTDRLALRLDLAPVGLRHAGSPPFDGTDVAVARGRLATVETPDQAVEALCAGALALGVDSMRGPLLALAVARASAALFGRRTIECDDLALAARLVLAPRATRLPPPPEADEAEADPQDADGDPPEDAAPQDPPEPSPEDRPDAPPEAPDDERPADPQQIALEDLVLAAARAALPENLLARLRLGKAAGGRSAGKAGAATQGTGRGRPSGTRRGLPGGGHRLDVVATLRGAAPWQPIRRRARPAGAPDRRVEVRRDDFRISRIKKRTETTTIFAVDASGSAAFQRLAEAKGAVELLLADCYVRRDQVALLAFRKDGADLLLPPTRSLVRAKRSLTELPGGGGTPLAAGIDAARRLADDVARRGRTPVVVLLTDGRANIARDGNPGRPQAGEDAAQSARTLRAAGHACLLVDTSPRPAETARRLAAEMGAVYLPLPYADAAALSRAVAAAAPAGRAGAA